MPPTPIATTSTRPSFPARLRLSRERSKAILYHGHWVGLFLVMAGEIIQPGKKIRADKPVCERPDSTYDQSSIRRVIAQIHIEKEIPPLITPPATCRQSQHNNGSGPQQTRCFSKCFAIYSTGIQITHIRWVVSSPLNRLISFRGSKTVAPSKSFVVDRYSTVMLCAGKTPNDSHQTSGMWSYVRPDRPITRYSRHADILARPASRIQGISPRLSAYANIVVRKYRFSVCIY